jgi:hypothetical protein
VISPDGGVLNGVTSPPAVRDEVELVAVGPGSGDDFPGNWFEFDALGAEVCGSRNPQDQRNDDVMILADHLTSAVQFERRHRP